MDSENYANNPVNDYDFLHILKEQGLESELREHGKGYREQVDLFKEIEK